VRTRHAHLILALVALVILAAGCGSSKKKSSAPPPATTAAAQTAPSTETAMTTTSGGNASAVANCPELAKLGSQFQAALSAANAQAKGDPAKEAQNSALLFAAFAKKAPSDIRGDFEVFAKALSLYASAIAKAHYKPGKVPSAAQIAALTAASKSFSSAEMAKASAHIQAWAQTHCHTAFGK
jgi:hypothetical protein